MNGFSFASEPALSFVVDVVFRATIVLAGTIIMAFLLRSASASARRLVWIGGLATVIALPGMMLFGPELPIVVARGPSAVAPVEAPMSPVDAATFPAALELREQTGNVSFTTDETADVPLAAKSPSRRAARHRSAAAPTAVDWPAWALLLLGFGILLQVIRVVVSLIHVRRLVTTANDIDYQDWTRDWDSACRRMGMDPRIAIKETNAEVTPLTCGVFKAAVLFPDVARDWTVDRRRAVMLHELAHVRQRDVAAILLARIACSVYFFHPLAWYAARQLRHDCERTCDDLVLNAGHRASDYATHLTAIARAFATEQRGLLLTIAMCHRSDIEQRVSAILDERQRRSRPRRAASVAAVCTAMLFALAIAAPRYSEAQSQNNTDNTPQIGRAAADSTHRPGRNNVLESDDAPQEWDVSTGKNVLWSAKLGSVTFGSPIVAEGKVFIGTNNAAGRVERLPSKKDLGCLMAFDSQTGQFLWQYSADKLPTGRVNDWPRYGIRSTPYVDTGRLWVVNNRAEVVCLDTDGFHDQKNDGPVTDEVQANNEADVIWSVDLIKTLGCFPHNHSDCAITSDGRLLFVIVPNGVDHTHVNLPAPKTASFVALDRDTGAIVWASSSASPRILHGQWSSAALAEVNGVQQVICPSGNGWLYGLEAATGRMIWKFDCNPKDAQWKLGPQGRRNNLIGMPMVYDGLVYIATGQDPEHGEGQGDLWCIDPTKRGDVSPEIMDSGQAKANPDSAVVWHFDRVAVQAGQKQSFEDIFHRSISTPAASDGLLVATDLSGLVHCFDAKTGRRHWAHDLFAATWGSPLIAGNRIYVADEDGDVAIFKLSKQLELVSEIPLNEAVYTTPVMVDNVLYIATGSRLFAIRNGAQSDAATLRSVRHSAAPDLEQRVQQLSAEVELLRKKLKRRKRFANRMIANRARRRNDWHEISVAGVTIRFRKSAPRPEEEHLRMPILASPELDEPPVPAQLPEPEVMPFDSLTYRDIHAAVSCLRRSTSAG